MRRRLVGRLHRRRLREREGLVLVEGVRAVTEVVACGAEIRFAVVAPRAVGGRSDALRSRWATEAVPVVEVDDRTFAELADTETPQGLLVVCVEPRPDPASLLGPRSRLLVADGVQDPGNLGTLIRTAAAFGVGGVIALDGTVDPWSPKTVRASAGTAFRIPVATARWDDFAPRIAAVGVPIWFADAAGPPVPPTAPTAPWALAVGSEGAGVRPEVRAAAHRAVSVPMPGGTESLNAGVAGAILLYAMTRGADGA